MKRALLAITAAGVLLGTVASGIAVYRKKHIKTRMKARI